MLINPSDHPVLMVEPAIQNKENRIKATEMLFEKFGFKGVFFQKVIY
jgi:actin-related protein